MPVRSRGLGHFQSEGWVEEQSLPALSRKRQAIAVELQIHGRTADFDRALSFEAMVDSGHFP